nr:MFS transporter [Actinopolyspora biskrensis]
MAFMLDLLDITIVNVALPAMQRDLGASGTEVEWFSAAYLLAFAVALITSARLGDLFGRKRMFLFGLTLFAVTSVWCGISTSPGELIAARAVQGVSAAMLAPQVMSILHTIFTGRERASVFGAFGVVAGIAQAGGMVLGGLLVSANIAGLSWRPIFLITVPVAVLLVLLGAWLVPESRASGNRPRWVSAGVLTVGLVAIVFPLLEGRVYGWPAWSWIMLIAGILIVVGLAYTEHSRPEWRAGALLPVGVFRSRTAAAGLVVQLVAFASFSGFLLIFAYWLQEGQGYTPLQAGVLTIAFSVGGLAMALFVGRLTFRFGRLVVLAGCLIGGAGALAVFFAGGQGATTGINGWALVPGLFALGVGMNMVMPPLTTLFLVSVPPELAGSASGVWTTSQQFGAAVGVAGLGTVFFSALNGGGFPLALTASMITMITALVVSAALCFVIAPRSQISM